MLLRAMEILTDSTGALLDIYAKRAGEFDIAHSISIWFAILLVQTYGAQAE